MIQWQEFALPIIIFFPVVAAASLTVVGILLSLFGLNGLPESVWRIVGLTATVVTLLLMLVGIAFNFDPEFLGLQHVSAFAGPESVDVRLLFGVDGIGLCFMVSTAAIVPLAMLLGEREVEHSIRSWVLACLLLESSLLGTLASANWFGFIFFWASSLVPILLWIGRWGGPGRSRAASRLWTTEAIGLGCLLFVAFVLREASLEQLGAPNLDVAATQMGSVGNLLDVLIDLGDQRVLFAVALLGLAVRLPIVPLHFWLPETHAAAPTGLSVVLATGFVQTAAIGIFRFALPLFPDAAVEAGPILSLVGISALVYGSLIALVQKELKRLVAYASVGYAGFALFGISTLNVQGITGAVLQLLMHGLATAALFLLIGCLARRRGTTEVAAFGGLAKPMPVCAFFFGVMVLSLMGLPALGGFVGDLFVLLGSLETRRELSVVALIAMVVAASYLLWVQRRLFLGPVEEPANRGLIDLDRVERSILLAMTIPIVVIGVYPNPVLRRIEPSVLEILYQMERRASPVEVPDPEAAPGEDAEYVLRRGGTR